MEKAQSLPMRYTKFGNFLFSFLEDCSMKTARNPNCFVFGNPPNRNATAIGHHGCYGNGWHDRCANGQNFGGANAKMATGAAGNARRQ